MQYLKIYFSFASAVFRCLSNDIALKGLFLHCVVFSLFCVAIVIFEPVFQRAYFGTDFATIRSNKFAARYFWFSETEAKEIHLKIVSGNLYLEDKNLPILIFSQKSSVVS